ncbi:DNA polymerase [Bienertia sinuspersici]
MKEYPMPGGAPVWKGNPADKELETLFGFIEAYVVCPTSLSKPFLPYRGYLFQKMESPFKEYVNSLKEWKGTSCRAGDEALLLDSGMRIPELFNSGEYKELLRMTAARRDPTFV